MTIPEILARYKKIAVVGLSPNQARPSHYVSQYMQEHGYAIVGVNPGHSEILGVPVYPTLADVPGPLEIVAVFRASEFLAEVVDAAIPREPKVLWVQLGIDDSSAEAKAQANGIEVVHQRCLMVEHRALFE